MAFAQPGTRSGPLQRASVVLVAALVALFFGLASVFLPAWFVVSALLLPAVLVVLLVRPEYALLACVALACNLIHPSLVPRVPFLGGSLAAADATLAMLVAYALWAFAANRGQGKPAPVAGGRLLAVAFGLFGASLALAVALSLTLRDLAPAVVLGEARDLLFLLTLPIAIVVLNRRQRQQRFVLGIVVLGCLFSIGQILQGVLNIPVFGKAGIGTLETLGYREYSTTRANTHGLGVIIFSAFLTIGAYVLGLYRKSILLAVIALLSMGILLTFGRTTFATVAVCVLVLVSWLNLKRLPWVVGLLVMFIAVVSAAASIWRPASFEAVVYRMTSIGAELDYGYSAGWRFMEADAMLPRIRQHPLTGIGLGADYKGMSGSSATPELNRYMHNAYLYMAGKMGVPALAFFLLMMGAIFAMGRRSAKSDASPWVRVVGAAGAVMMIRFVFASITEPHFMVDHGVVVIAIVGALVYLSAQRTAAARSSASPSGPLQSAGPDAGA